MKQGLDWYKRDPRAFLDGVQGMGPELIGCYAVLLDLIYARGGDTLRDDRHLAGVLGCSVRMARTLTDQLIKAKKITQTGDTITNKRAEKDAKQRRNERETLANHGRMGGERSGESRKNNNLAEAIREEKSREEYPPIVPPLEERTENGRTIRSSDAADTATPGQPGSISEADENGMDAGTGEGKPKADDKPKPKTRSPGVKRRIAEDRQPDHAAIAYAGKLGVDVRRTWPDFVDYHIRRDTTATERGFAAAWRTWCRKALEFAERDKRLAGPARPGKPSDWIEAFAMAEREANGGGQHAGEAGLWGNDESGLDSTGQILPFGRIGRS